ncbi:cell division protein ZapE [Luteimonas suaedae]|uniref:cell division protein ZapE n=1 Tax=Luteimonas suaedae TaxID=2605430 RepID=UPI0011EE21DE|nr:cell division protein ZapE [Luteimonas suaedae]
MAEAEAAPTPSQAYDAGIARDDWQDDPAQRAVLRELDRIHAALSAAPARGGLLGRLLGGAPDPVPGLYLWGGVGRGKTFLIDLFFRGLALRDLKPEALDGATPERGRGEGKRRTHFHRFMREVHAGLRAHSGERDPLAAIVHGWREAGLRVLVLDEFFVSDIGDAMLLARLLERMFAESMVLVTSSNTAPSDLYRGGLQRVRFLPAIELIEHHCHVLHMQSDTDYRLRALTRSPVYRAPLDDDADAWLQRRWRELGGDDGHRDAGIEVEGRRIAVRARAPGMAWFDFDALCEGPRGANDYIEIAREFHTVLLGGVPVLDGRRDDAARRFVTLVDELYDRHVNLVCTAAAEPPELYVGERLQGAFERTASRLIEMRSAEYLAREHQG